MFVGDRAPSHNACLTVLGVKSPSDTALPEIDDGKSRVSRTTGYCHKYRVDRGTEFGELQKVRSKVPTCDSNVNERT